MIIWGWKAKDKPLGTGSFFCPGCRQETSFTHIRTSRYFTLYFIPLFPMATLNEYLLCGTCQSAWSPEILQLPREEIQAALEPWTCPRCNNKNAAGQDSCLGCGASREAPATMTAPPPTSHFDLN